jgi:hypothetical protein
MSAIREMPTKPGEARVAISKKTEEEEDRR